MPNTHQSNNSDVSVEPNTIQFNCRKAYFVGSGIASLAGAVFLIRDGLIPGENIQIFEELEVTGGSLDGASSPDKGYVVRSGRMIEEHYVCTYDLFASIPSLTNLNKSVKEEIFEFSHKYVSSSRCRLIRDGKKVDVSSFGLSEKDRLDLMSLTAHSEHSLGTKRIVICGFGCFVATLWSNHWFYRSVLLGRIAPTYVEFICPAAIVCN